MVKEMLWFVAKVIGKSIEQYELAKAHNICVIANTGVTDVLWVLELVIAKLVVQ